MQFSLNIYNKVFMAKIQIFIIQQIGRYILKIKSMAISTILQNSHQSSQPCQCHKTDKSLIQINW